VSDLGLLLGVTWINALLSVNPEWMFGKITCQIYVLWRSLTADCSITTLMFISVDRYVIIGVARGYGKPLWTYRVTYNDPLFTGLELETSNLTCRGVPTKGKLGQRVMKGSRDLLFEFWDPLHIYGTVQARNFKFGIQIDHEEFLRNKIKIRSKRVAKGSRDLLLEFCNPLYISRTICSARKVVQLIGTKTESPIPNIVLSATL